MFDRPGTVRVVLRAACAAFVLAALSGCGAPPQKEMDQAEGAIVAARAAGAAQYAAVEFTAAEAALKRSHEAAAQRDFRQSLNHALDARERAQTAAREAADKKAVARGLAERAITSAELALATAQQRLGAELATPLPTGRRTAPHAAAFKALQEAATSANIALQEARSQLQEQRFEDARVTATPVQAKILAATRMFDVTQAAPSPARGSRRSR